MKNNKEKNKFYFLPELPYEYKSLEPYMGEEQLRIHHDKHHKSYVDGANQIFKHFDEARKSDELFNVKAALKELSFYVGGDVLHTLFWANLTAHPIAPEDPGEELFNALEDEFGSFDRFKEEFTDAAVSIEGSGWASLAFCTESKRPLLMQIEKHNVNVYPMFKILLILDMWEHAYYIDYKNNKKKYIEAFWNIVNWKEVDKRYQKMAKR